MFCGFSILGSNSFSENALPASQTFSKIKILGESSIDEVHVHNTEIADNTILNTSTEETFGEDTILLAHFSKNLQCGNYTGLDNTIDKYLIQKRKVGDSQYVLVQEVARDSGITSVVDYTSKNNKEYIYSVIPVDANGIMGTSSTANVTLNFWGWYLSNLDNTVCYRFDLNIESSNIQNMLNINIQTANSKFPKVTQNKQNYIQSSLSTIPFSFNGIERVFDIDVLENIRAFLTDGETKVLRNTAGEGMQVRIASNPQIKYIDEVQRNGSSPFVLTFEYVQTGVIS